MKIVLAPNAFKGSVTAAGAAAAMARGAQRAAPGCLVDEVPIADGGDGLHDVAIDALGGEDVPVRVSGPRFDLVDAGFVFDRKRSLAVIEMARASGLALLAGQDLDPTVTSTQGTGELIRAALDAAPRHVLVGIGGSATNDGGIGMAVALGWRFLDTSGHPVTPVGGELSRIAQLDGSSRDGRLDETTIEVVCDVDNPLCGPRGASRTYGPQKGATPRQVDALDDGLGRLADLVAAATGFDGRDEPGAGAAGGIGFGLRAFAGGTLRRGTDVIFDLVGLDARLEGADLVITGEGQIDEQTRMGKAPAAVADRARRQGIPCIAIAGAVGEGVESLHDVGLDAVFSLCPGPCRLEEAMANAETYLERATEQVVRGFAAGRIRGAAP